ncbi:hypothetical protein E2R68_08725 [Psychromonas sp. RZ22]|uniref:hypothetical protein n=1 Tax=Psychromonas algarum TaxID=2555643 RepID=UPI0010684485|nr:hypothetical protein [Psychromonas sp. RZ22]TEW54346.1 hypothetical protein E2R68_08725 [Psychromonas sp. RZ22]
MHNKPKFTTANTSLLNDCTNHIAFQLKKTHLDKNMSQHRVERLYETPIAEVVTKEYVKGYN